LDALLLKTKRDFICTICDSSEDEFSSAFSKAQHFTITSKGVSR